MYVLLFKVDQSVSELSSSNPLLLVSLGYKYDTEAIFPYLYINMVKVTEQKDRQMKHETTVKLPHPWIFQQDNDPKRTSKSTQK